MDQEIVIRTYQKDDLNTLLSIFEKAIRQTCQNDYTIEQLNAWIAGKNAKNWDEILQKHFSYVATIDKNIVGFGDVNECGYINFLYVDPIYQKRGVATSLLKELERRFDNLEVDASKTALPFFLKRGYQIEKTQVVYRQNIAIENYHLHKKKS